MLALVKELIKLNEHKSSMLILVFLSILNVFLRKSVAIGLTLSLFIMVSAFYVSILVISSFSFLAFHGVEPVSSSQKMIPKAQMSVFNVYSFLFKDQGAIYKGDPTLYLLYLCASAALMANPKSAIFSYWFQVTKILAGFKSLCIICFLAKFKYPVKICCIKVQACCSPKPFLTSLFRSDQQSSVTIYVLFLVVNTSQRLRMCGRDLSYLSMCIQLSSKVLLIQFLSILRSMTLTATHSLVSSFFPLQTWLEYPLPMASSSPQEQFYIFLRVKLAVIGLVLRIQLLRIIFNLELQQNYLINFIPINKIQVDPKDTLIFTMKDIVLLLVFTLNDK